MVREQQIHMDLFALTSDFPAVGHWKSRGLASKSCSMMLVACRKQQVRECCYARRLRQIRVGRKEQIHTARFAWMR